MSSRIPPIREFPNDGRIWRIGRLHATVTDQRREHLHHVSAAVVASAELIAIEDLAVKGMGRAMHRGFRRSVADPGLGELRRQITYRAGWHQRVLVVVDRWVTSSKTCSACGHVHTGLTLRDRRRHCPACDADHDRDLNAAINPEREGQRVLASDTGPAGRTPRSG